MISVDFRELTNLSNAVTDKKQELQTQLNMLKAANDSLKKAWKGPDADLYQRKAAEQADTIQNFINALGELGEYIAQAKAAYERVQNENLNNI